MTMNNQNMNNQSVNNQNKKEMSEMKKTIATPENVAIETIPNTKVSGNLICQAFCAVAYNRNDGKKGQIHKNWHVRAEGFDSLDSFKSYLGEYVRNILGASHYHGTNKEGIRNGCYYKVVGKIETASQPTEEQNKEAENVVVNPKGARVLVTGTNSDILTNIEFKRDVHALVMKAQAAGAVAVEFVNNGSLGSMFIEFGKRLFAGYQPMGLQVYTAIVADGVHKEFFATLDTGNKPEEPTPAPKAPTPSAKKTREAVESIPATPETTAEVKAEAIRFYTDGSAKGSGESRRAGWAWVAQDSWGSKANGNLGNATNNVAELTAIKEALDYAVHSLGATNVEIVSDSKYAIGVSQGSMKASKNVELVNEIHELMNGFESVTFTWVKGHAGNALNEECDHLAKEGADGIIYDADLEAESALTEQDAQEASAEAPAAPTTTENNSNAADNLVESTEAKEEVSSNAATISEDSKVLNAAESADSEEKKGPVGAYCCKKEVEAKDFWPETPSGKTEEEIWDLLGGIVNQEQ